MSSFQLAWLSLIRRPLSTFLALSAIALAVGGCGILLRVYILMQDRFNTIAHGGDAIVGAKAGGIEILLGALNAEGDYPDFLPFKLFETLRAQQAVHFEDGSTSVPNYLKQVVPFLYCGKVGEYRVAATDTTFFARPDSADDLKFDGGSANFGNGDEIVLGALVAENLHSKVGADIEVSAWSGGETLGRPRLFKVIGILKPTHSQWDRLLYTSITSGQGLIANEPSLSERSIWGANVLNYFLIYLNPNGFKPLKDLINKRTVGQAIFTTDERKHLEDLTGTGQKIGFVISILVILLGGLSVASMLVTRFDAAGVQLAILRALGYRRREVAMALLFEGFLLGIGACLIGMTIDLILFPVLRWSLSSSLPSAELVKSYVWQSSPVWAAAIVATMMSVFIPLYKLYHQDVHRALRD